MRYAHLKQFDLNLLLSFQALIEERSVNRAARRMFLSPLAMSRIFSRLRKMFEDDLLVRTREGYKATDRALRAYSEIEVLLPRLEGVLQAQQFDPATAEDTFRIALPDSLSTMKLPRLMKQFAKTSPGVRFEVSILDDQVHENLKQTRSTWRFLSIVPPSRSGQNFCMRMSSCVCSGKILTTAGFC